MAYNNLTLFPTLRCNLRCPHCTTKGTVSANAKDWTHTYFSSVVKRLASLNLHFRTINFGGGEPTIWPYLRQGIIEVKESGLCDNVQILTNGTTTDPDVYANADVVRVTDYGGSNRWYFRKLRKHLGKRLHVCPSIHVPLPAPYTEEVSCNFLHPGIIGRKIYKCCTQAKDDIDGYDLFEDGALDYLNGPLPNTNERCHTCMGNRCAYEKIAPPLTFQCQVWGVEELSKMIQFPFNARKLRTIYQKLRSRRGR